MNLSDIHALIDQVQTSDNKVSFIETHISWVLLFPEYVYKIKKPVSFSFLDFSTLEKRKDYCHQEVQLNNRLTDGVYLGVVPLYRHSGKWFIGEQPGETTPLDYAVKMKRLDRSREMDILLKNNQVTDDDIIKIAEQLANFHAFTDIIESPFELAPFQENFADIIKIKPFAKANWGSWSADRMDHSIERSSQFLKKYEYRLRERHEQGFTVDGHGDLHSGNIFLLEKPVIFDCIEFNPKLRHLDVLNEIGFFCMDLNFFGESRLEVLFLEHYQQKNPCILNEADQLIFQYYKWYRANVRLKVTALKAQQLKEENNEQEYLRQKDIAEDYFQLFRSYE